MTDDKTPSRKKAFGIPVAIAIAASTVVGGFAGFQALADTKMGQHMKVGFKKGERGHRGPRTVEQMQERVDRMIAHAAIEIDATDEQVEQITAIANAAVAEVHPLRQSMREDTKKLRELLTAATLDKAQIEQIRAARLADFDAKSKIIANAVTEIAEILTPEQRVLLEERIEEFRGHHRGGRRH
ncbi:Spy/CpxP family protein refolding chaperone [Rhodobacteraceae bacterium NNCM2]|nr:Spy/CpxP family protein refolding chaperone [Coraliihabitans acroporae]